MFLISGITGNLGGAAAAELLKSGQKVRALVRDAAKAAAWAGRGVEIRVGDFNDRASLIAALAGVEGAFLMMPPQFPTTREFREARATAANYREALDQVRVPRVVVLSSWGSEKADRLGPITSTHIVETTLRGTSSPIAFSRAGSFLENIPFSAAAESGSFVTDVKPGIPMVASADIGALIARLLEVDGWRGERVLELGTVYAPDEIAKALTAAVGRPVTVRLVSTAETRARLIARGMPPLMADLLEEMKNSQNDGWIAFGAPGAEQVPATITPQAFFERLQRASGG